MGGLVDDSPHWNSLNDPFNAVHVLFFGCNIESLPPYEKPTEHTLTNFIQN